MAPKGFSPGRERKNPLSLISLRPDKAFGRLLREPKTKESTDAEVPRKVSKHIYSCPYRKPTQVGEMRILRRVEEPLLRNSAN